MAVERALRPQDGDVRGRWLAGVKWFFTRFGGPLLVGAFFAAAVVLLDRELKEHSLAEIRQRLGEIPARAIVAAVALTVLNYLILSTTDLLALYRAGRALSPRRVMLASLLGYAFGNSLGATLGGSSVRARLYTRWGVSGSDLVRVIAGVALTFWSGACALGGVVFTLWPVALPRNLHAPIATSLPLGLGCLGLAAAYLAFAVIRRRPFRVRRLSIDPPGWRVALLQILVGATDLLTAAAVLYCLLPASFPLGFAAFAPMYLLGVTAGLISHVPGGLGVLELVVLWLVPPGTHEAVLGSLIAYRAIYYLAPLCVGMAVMATHEARALPPGWRKAAAVATRWVPAVAPRLVTAGVFLAGVVLLISGSVPAAGPRLELLRGVVPLPVVELSHFLGSVAGAALLVLARGLQRRIDSAYWATVALLGAGAGFSLAKGLDYEEAVVLGLVLLLLVPGRRYYFRKGRLLRPEPNARWLLAIGLVILATVWLTLFAYKHVEYSRDLWWQFAFFSDAPRSLRALVGAAAVAVLAGTAGALSTRRTPPGKPAAEDFARAAAIVRRCGRTSSNLALLGDKRFLFSEDGAAFVMFGVEGNSWVAMGDPIGPEPSATAAAWAFRELCDEQGAWPVFYEVGERNLGRYVEMGLVLVKLGEEAFVPLEHFGLEGGSRKDLRKTDRRLTELGYRFEIVPAAEVPAHMATFRAISDAWLEEKRGGEKGFSLGFFDPDYLSHFDVALVSRDGEPVAFANVWRGAGGEELSVDLMRFRPDAAHGVMEWLLIRLMLQGKAEGYRWFNLGMAPLSGIESRDTSPLWNKLSALAYRHGGRLYNFEGLRRYKEKFEPEWRGAYLASPGGLALPRILTNVATLIGGGTSRLIGRQPRGETPPAARHCQGEKRQATSGPGLAVVCE